MNKMAACRFDVGMIITLASGIHTNEGIATKFVVEGVTEVSPREYAVYCRSWNDSTLAHAVLSPDEVAIEGSYAYEIRRIDKVHAHLHRVVNLYLDSIGYTEIARDVFDDIYACIYDERAVEAIKLMRTSTQSINVYSLDLGAKMAYPNAFAEYIKDGGYDSVNAEAKLGLKQAKEIVDILKCNL